MLNDLGPAAVYGWLSLPGRKPNSAAELAGAAILLSSDIAVTCAHVVRDHLGLAATPAAAPETPVTLRFEAANTEVEAVVVPNGWYPDNPGGPAGGLRDVAFLRLSASVTAVGLRPRGFAAWVPRMGRPALVIGAEPGYQVPSQEVSVKLAAHPNNRNLWALNAVSDMSFAVVRGFSGAPLLDEEGTVIWGMVVEVDAKGRRVAFAVGAEDLADAYKLVLDDANRKHQEQVFALQEQLTANHKYQEQLTRANRKYQEQVSALQEQLTRANMNGDAELRDREVLRKSQRATA